MQPDSIAIESSSQPPFDPWQFNDDDDTDTTAFEVVRRGAVRRRTCRRFAIVTYRAGSYRMFQRPCEQWGCERCGPTRIAHAMTHLESVSPGDLAYLTHVAHRRDDGNALKRIDDRLAYRQGESMRIRKHRSMWVVSDVDLAGRRYPFSSSSHEADRLIPLVTVVASFPHVRKITWSDGWRPPRYEQTGDGIKVAGDEAEVLAKALALARVALRDGGYRWEDDERLPEGHRVPPEVLQEAVCEALQLVRAGAS